MVVDEPMVGLDPKSIRLVKDLLREQARTGTTVFMSTHTLAVAEEIGDRIGILLGGKLKFIGPLNLLKEEFKNHSSSLEEIFLEMTGKDTV